MKLKNPDLEDRSFLIQFHDILTEFGNEIPRLHQIKHLKYITNVDFFKHELFKQLDLPETEKIQPYILTTDDKKEEYIGGLLNFSKSPEVFIDQNNEIIKNQLESEKYAYITCLQIRDVLRGNRNGVELFSKSVEQILTEFHQFRGVVSKEELLNYYRFFGIKPINNGKNEDGLYIVTGNEKTFIKRH